MTLLFIENRHKTYFFESIASILVKEGHSIHWIVQNKEFTPRGDFKTHIINYPKNRNYKHSENEEIKKVILSDRQLNHFKKKGTAYFYYYNDEIKKILISIKPDFVFGESTAFHELLTINNCQQQGILYLNPSSCRYPIGRFSFYKYNTLEPYQGSGEILSTAQAKKTIDQIITRKALPDYMKPSPVTKSKKVKDQIKKIISFIKGEKYNTPNPLVKFQLEQQKKKNIDLWDKLAVKSIDKSAKFKILYPLQMQPEANIDVWGRKYRNQLELVKTIAKTLPENAVLYVKPNPKSKYELTKNLIKQIQTAKNIIALHHTTKMDDVIKDIDMVITVTGTVAIECVLNNKPVITLVNTINNTALNCKYVKDINKELIPVINSVKDKTFYKLNDEEKINFINTLNGTSYKGIISDPFSDDNCVDTQNINDIVLAMRSILKSKQNTQESLK